MVTLALLANTVTKKVDFSRFISGSLLDQHLLEVCVFSVTIHGDQMYTQRFPQLLKIEMFPNQKNEILLLSVRIMDVVI